MIGRCLVKVCGITTFSGDSETWANVDWIGLNFWPRSPRHLTLDAAESLAPQLPAHLLRVGVFLDPVETLVHDAIAAAGLGLLQFHGDESPEFCRRFGLPFVKAFAARGPQVASRVPDYVDGPESWYLLDAAAGGGSGMPVDLSLARALREQLPGRMILAGGLRPDSVAAAIAAVEPAGVDVASGVESAPGVKDPARVRAFTDAIRKAP
ncbi:MAG: phosphoribosylanthranilate isomerase [Myxococcales bacterium]|nr:phosphoribosylanthranilate isomerase [Myxococcales bacterium]